MIPYRSKSGKTSGVLSYEIGNDYIKVKFPNKKIYKYPISLNGESTIEKMKSLAIASVGLSTFIAKHKAILKFV